LAFWVVFALYCLCPDFAGVSCSSFPGRCRSGPMWICGVHIDAIGSPLSVSVGVCRCLSVSVGVCRCLLVSLGVFRCISLSTLTQREGEGEGEGGG